MNRSYNTYVVTVLFSHIINLHRILYIYSLT